MKFFILVIGLSLVLPSVSKARVEQKQMNKPRYALVKHNRTLPLLSKELETALMFLQTGKRENGSCQREKVQFVDSVHQTISAKEVLTVLDRYNQIQELKEVNQTISDLDRIGLRTMLQSDLTILWLIKSAASSSGSDPVQMLSIAWSESLLGRKVDQPLSSATGSYQIISSTWFRLVKDWGPKYGLTEWSTLIDRARDGTIILSKTTSSQRTAILSLRKDPWISTALAMEHLGEITNNLRTYLRRTPTQGEIYLAWVLGLPQTKDFIDMLKVDSSIPTDEVLGDEIVFNNPSIFINLNGDPKTLKETVDSLNLEQVKLYTIFKRLVKVDERYLQARTQDNPSVKVKLVENIFPMLQP